MFNKSEPINETTSNTTMLIYKAPKMTLTVEEMAEELNISNPTAYNLVKQKPFPAFHIGQRILVNRDGLQRWIDAQCQAEAVG